MTGTFQVRTEAFEGPLELLLELIEARKLHINDVSLASVTDDFLEHLKALDEVRIRDITEFIVIAATLLLIKSKSLLPLLSLTEDEEGDIKDLERRLALYERIRSHARALARLFGPMRLFEGKPARMQEAVFAPSSDLSVPRLAEALGNVLSNLPKPPVLKQARVAKTISLEEMIGRLEARIKQAMKLSFKDFSGMGRAAKVDAIVSFLAVLELVKRGIITASQGNVFTDITLESGNISTPSYE